jgi:hypothetical protein
MVMIYAVRTTHGHLLRIEADPETSIGDFKSTITGQLASPEPAFVKLYFRGLPPDDDSTLGSVASKPTDFFVAHILSTPPDVSDDFEDIEIRADSDEEETHYEEQVPEELFEDREAMQDDPRFRQLLEMQFSPEAAHRALQMSQGDLNVAVDLLVRGQVRVPSEPFDLD